MKRVISGVLLLTAVAVSAEVVNILFDKNDEKRDALVVKAPAKIVKGTAFSGEKLLEIPGTKQNFQYSVNFKPVPVKPDDKVGFSCVYRTSKKFASALVVCIYRDEKNKLIKSQNVRLNRRLSWDRLEHVFTTPNKPKIKTATVYVRLPNIPKTETLYLDNLRCGKLDEKTPFRCTTLSNIDFGSWRNDTMVQERFLPGSGGQVLRDWQIAKLGEACILAEGRNSAFQYPMMIKQLSVEAGCDYVFSFNFRTTGPYVAHSGMFIAFFRDENGKLIRKQSRIRMAASKSWLKRDFIFTAPEKAASVDIGLRLYKQSPAVKLYVDGIDFARAKPSLRLTWKINSETKKLSGVAEVVSVKSTNPIEVLVKDKNGKVVKTVKSVSKSKFTIDLSKLPDGPYRVSAGVKVAEGNLTSSTETFNNYNKCTWHNNIGVIGKNDNPPKPWKPLKYDASANTVTTWNSVISFNRTLDILKIKSINPDLQIFNKQTLLSVNGQNLGKSYKVGKIKVASVSPNHILLQSSLSSATMDIIVKARVEYDGFVKYALELKPKTEITINSLNLKYFPKVMEWQVCYDGSWTNFQLVDLRKKNLSLKRFYPLIWNGDSQVGVYWCAEQLFPATEIMPRSCQDSDRNKGVEINMVCAPMKLAGGKSKTFEYGFGTTPVRPRRKAGRNLRFRAGKKYSNMDLAWSQPTNLKYFGFPMAENSEVFPTYLEHNKGKMMSFYQCPQYVMTSLPQWKYYETKWISSPIRIYSKKTSMKRYGYDAVKVDVSQRTWTDLYMKNFSEFLKKYKFGGVYYDCMNIGVDTKGEFRYRVFALRDFYSRIYAEQVKRNPDTWFFLHSGATFFTIGCIFADITLTGEEYRSKCYDNDFYLQFLSPEEFRSQMCTNTGAWRMFLPQFRNERSKKPEVAVHVLGLTLVYNLMLYPSFIERVYVDRMRDRKFAFIDAGGRDNWKFVPYWKNNPANNKKVLCSSYVNPKGQLLACINATAKSQVFKLKIPARYSKIYVYDPLTDKTETVESSSSIKLKPYMAKMILVADKPIWTP
jgi:Glycoside hydrolase 123, N-terminal domain